MEVVVPLFALSSLYLINNQNKKKDETEEFSNQKALPNTNVPDSNYSNEDPTETDTTASLSVNNRYDNGGGVYTDKYFNQQKTSSEGGTEYMSLDGSKVTGDYFQHNNMVPFFGGHLKTSPEREETNESILDNATGSGSQFIKKQEQSPLF